jgi:hypothetical protein
MVMARRLVSWLMTPPEKLPAHEHSHLYDLLTTCPHLTTHGRAGDPPELLCRAARLVRDNR